LCCCEVEEGKGREVAILRNINSTAATLVSEMGGASPN
jgi:hypothetical protein